MGQDAEQAILTHIRLGQTLRLALELSIGARQFGGACVYELLQIRLQLCELRLPPLTLIHLGL